MVASTHVFAAQHQCLMETVREVRLFAHAVRATAIEMQGEAEVIRAAARELQTEARAARATARLRRSISVA